MRAYRRRVTKKRNVTPPAPPTATIAKKRRSRTDKGLEEEAKRLKQEVLRLSRKLAAVQRPNHAMAIIIDKVAKGTEPVRYVARHADGAEWDQGATPKEALGGLVLSFAASRPVTVESVEFSY